DYDNDGDTDVFVGNDVAGNSIFENDGSGRFEEVGLMTGLAYDYTGTPQGTMGVDCGDYNNDGLLDFFVTSYQRDLATLYRNMGDGLFEDVTQATGAGEGSFAYVTWGNGLVDFDNDGDLDLFVACGHLHDNVALFDRTTSYHVPNLMLENQGGEKFVNVSRLAGDGMQVKLSSRGAAFGDLDNDGDMDAVILNSRREPTLLRNDTSPRRHWLEVRLQGRESNRDGIGAHVSVMAGDLRQMAEVHSGRGYQGHYGLRLHFGLGSHEHIDRIEVQWLGGGRDVLEDVPVDQRIKIVQGSSPSLSLFAVYLNGVSAVDVVGPDRVRLGIGFIEFDHTHWRTQETAPWIPHRPVHWRCRSTQTHAVSREPRPWADCPGLRVR
ncbi:MAG: CRTAC1 family protein, partial [Planctomycetes bacterium]|nr:CRTAC1 family protein [Planctomycetota bacterium]